MDALALAVVLLQPFRPMVLSGAATVEQLRSNAAALGLADRLAADGAAAVDVQQLLEACRQDPQQYWDERSKLAWN